MKPKFEVLKPSKEEIEKKHIKDVQHVPADCLVCAMRVPPMVDLYGTKEFFERWDEHVSWEGGDIVIDRANMADHLAYLIAEYQDPLARVALKFYSRGNFVTIQNKRRVK